CKVVVPSNPADAYGLLLSCIFDDDPCLIVENTLLYFSGGSGPAPEPGTRVPLGKANIVQPGTDVTVIGYGRPLLDALGVAQQLAKEGVSVEVIDLRTVAPYDEQCVLESVARTKRAVIVHEGVRKHGVGAEIAARITEELFSELAAPVGRVGAKFSPVPYAMTLEATFYPSTTDLLAAIRKTLG
ncbi:MAG: alpha-ketoacid dehydrogenase subunit beta, partial [Acidimicrobiia bacterium]